MPPKIQTPQLPPSCDDRGCPAEMRFAMFDSRLNTIEEASAEHARQLGDGRVQFATVTERLSALTAKVEELISVVKWAAAIIATAVAGAILKLVIIGA